MFIYVITSSDFVRPLLSLKVSWTNLNAALIGSRNQILQVCTIGQIAGRLYQPINILMPKFFFDTIKPVIQDILTLKPFEEVNFLKFSFFLKSVSVSSFFTA